MAAMEPIDRVVRALGDEDLPDRLADVAGADFTTLLLDVFKRRVAVTTPAAVMRQRTSDRFVAPGRLDLKMLHRVEANLLAALPQGIDALVLSPLAPLGLHSALASVDQGRLVSTIRRTEVAADPTVALAVEAAVRRRVLLATEPKSVERVRLATIQRVVRAQRFETPVSFPHFTLLGLVTAGRDTGSHEFEADAMAEHATTMSTCLLAAGADHVTVRVADWTGGVLGGVADRVRDDLAGENATVRQDLSRTRARGYYLQGALEIDVRFGASTFSAADGGLVDWTQSLLASRKERLMISGIGVDRVAIALGQ